MQSEDKKSVRLGKVSKSVEKALGIPFTTGNSVYLLNEDADALAKKRPKHYLREIEEMSEILKNPDWVTFVKEEGIFYVKEYIKDGRFRHVLLHLKQKGRPKKWSYYELICPSEEVLRDIDRKAAFKKPILKENKA